MADQRQQVDNKLAKKLSILLGVDSFSYMVCGAERVLQQYFTHTFKQAQGKHPDELSDLLYRHRAILDPSSYQQVEVGIFQPIFTVVPDRLYQNGQDAAYIEHLTPLQEQYALRSESLTDLKARFIYAVPRASLRLLQQQFATAEPKHLVAALTQQFPRLIDLREGPHLLCYITDKRVLLVAYANGDFLFANSFGFRSSNDFIYYVLLAFDQLKMDPYEANVYYSGKLAEEGEIHKLLHRYIDKVQPLPLPEEYTLRGDLKQHPAYYYLDLLSLLM